MEYTIPLILFCGTILVILNAFDINSHIAEWFASSTNADRTGRQQMQVRALGSDVMNNNPSETMQVCVNQNSLCVSMPSWMAEGRPQNHEVAGSMGEEIAFASSEALSEIVEQLKEDNADPQIISAIENLANLSHNRAEYLDNLATMADNLCPPEAVICSTRQSSFSEGFSPDGQVFFTTQRDGDYVRVKKPRLQDYLSYGAIQSADNNHALMDMVNLENSAMPSHWKNDWYKYMDILDDHRSVSSKIESQTPAFKTPEAQAAYEQYLADSRHYYEERGNKKNTIENWQADYKDLSSAQHAFHNLLKDNQEWLNKNYYNKEKSESVTGKVEFFMDENTQFQQALSTVEKLTQENPNMISDEAWRMVYENASNVDHVWKTHIPDPTPVSVDIERTQTTEVKYNPNEICKQSQGGDCIRNNS